MANTASKQNILKASQIFGDYIVMILAPCIVSVMYYGSRAMAVIAVSILSAVVCDFAASFIIRKRFLLRDTSNIFIGAAIAMMMPASVPLYVPAIASAAGVLTAKIPFGGSLRAPFVPAAAGFAIASVCFKEQVFTYAQNTEDKLFGANSLASLLAQGSSVHINKGNVFEIISGNISGPMGTGCGILMVACCCYLFVRRRSALLATGGFIAACVIFAVLFPRVNSNALTSVVLELSAGSLLFGAVFLITDVSTLPKGSVVKVAYGAVCGVICMIMRSVGTYEETVCFAALMANGFSPVIESSVKVLSSRKMKKGAAEK
ncbi:MAG: RnfABCDGE type electron transport complex subunit D [Clostridia bacterium]|nr:RnfABCDGE type electron transport complex subunit D [Clostridia bacterium]